MNLKLLLLLVAGFVKVLSAQIEGENYLLPNTTKPEFYAIVITTNVPAENLEFTGILALTLRVVETTNELFLHSRQHTILDFKLYEKDSTEALENVSQTRENDNVIKFTSQQQLEAGTSYDLHISYQGNLMLVSDGFFRSNYVVNESGNDIFT